ncbi:MAG: recombinase zinc beta ribbon domain-containing protein, partial [Oscillospiraceae bacterium]
KMTVSIVEYMLKNRRYIGEYRYREIVQEGGIPAIVPKELFDSVQERMQKNKRAPSRHKAEDDYLLTTKLFCGKCGATMVGECGTSRTGVTHRYYRCSTSKKKRACDKKTVKKDWIENLVVSKTMETLMNDALMQDLSNRLFILQKKENTAVPALKKQLAEIQKAIENMLNAIQSGIFNESTKNRLDRLEEQKGQLEISILQEQLQRPFLTKEQILFWLHKFRKMDMTDKVERQRLIDSFVNAIYLFDDKLVITFNYKDGTKTISLDEVNGSDLTGIGVPQVKLPLVFYCKTRGNFYLSYWIRLSCCSFCKSK